MLILIKNREVLRWDNKPYQGSLKELDGKKIKRFVTRAGLVWDKSGLAAQYGLHTLAGVIDAGYRGEILVSLINLSQETQTISLGQKISQLLIQPVVLAEVKESKIFQDTSRGSGGFGSTGL